MSKPFDKHSRQMAVWNHNGLLGVCMFANKGMQRILASPTATEDSKRLAGQALAILVDLYTSLKTRKDQLDMNILPPIFVRLTQWYHIKNIPGIDGKPYFIKPESIFIMTSSVRDVILTPEDSSLPVAERPRESFTSIIYGPGENDYIYVKESPDEIRQLIREVWYDSFEDLLIHTKRLVESLNR